MSSTKTEITYTKLRSGSWGVRGPSDMLSEGRTVTVVKRSGESNQVQVERVLWSGNGISIASIASSGAGSSSSRRPRPRGRSCRLCGCTEPSCGAKGICQGPAFDPCHDCL